MDLLQTQCLTTDVARWGSFLCSVGGPVTNELLHSLNSNLKRCSAHSEHTNHPEYLSFPPKFSLASLPHRLVIISRIKLEFALGLVFLAGGGVTARCRCELCGTAGEAEKWLRWIPAPLFSITQN